MSGDYDAVIGGLDARIENAIRELKATILQKYPGTTFEISRGHDEPENIHLEAIVDLEDPDEVLDLLGEQLDRLQVDEGIPVHVILLRTPERILAALNAGATPRHRRRLLSARP